MSGVGGEGFCRADYRERLMAMRVLEGMARAKDAVGIFFAGNIHTKAESNCLKVNVASCKAGFFLGRLLGDRYVELEAGYSGGRAYGLRYESGEFFTREFEISSKWDCPQDKSRICLNIGKLTASPPHFLGKPLGDKELQREL
jgi:hypothetical protein